MITLRTLTLAGLLGWAGASGAATLTADAPPRYVVRSGDTLWGLAAKYLADPWAWPQLWRAGHGIDNPNRLYPGDVLTLHTGADGQPELTVTRAGAAADAASADAGDDTVHWRPQARADALPSIIPTLPPGLTAAFMARPTLLSSAAVAAAPYVIGFDHDRLAGGPGAHVYVRGALPPGDALAIIHVGEQVRDPDGGHPLGVESVYVGTARVEHSGDGARVPADLVITGGAREALPGDRIVALGAAAPADVVPHAPAHPIRARIAAVTDGVEVIGQYAVVLLNRGERDGVTAGDVLTLSHQPGRLADHGPGAPGQEPSGRHRGTVKLPEDRAGTVLVFRTYAEASYGLVLAASSELRVGDTARSP